MTLQSDLDIFNVHGFVVFNVNSDDLSTFVNALAKRGDHFRLFYVAGKISVIKV